MPDGMVRGAPRAIVVVTRVSAADRAASERQEAPRADFDVLAQLVKARIVTAADFDPSTTGPIQTAFGKHPAWATVYAALAASREAEHIYVASEDLAFRLVPLLKMEGWKGRVHVVVHDCHTWRRQSFLRLLGHDLFGTYLTDTSAQAEFLVRGAGVPQEKVRVYVNPVDTDFFNPKRVVERPEGQYVFACGQENRDYATLEDAARRSARMFRVQASGYFPSRTGPQTRLPANYHLNKTRVSYMALRDLYAGSRMVVLPLNDVPYAAGVTGLLEAMALGKPVIVSASRGIRDYTRVPSLVVVPPGDAARIAAEIERLCDAPKLRQSMGEANLAWARANGHVESYGMWAAAQMGLPVSGPLPPAG